MQTISPSSKQVFAKLTDKEVVTKSGIYLSEKTADVPQTAEVINVGDEVRQCKAKDTIVFKQYTTTEIKLNGDDYIMLDEADVLGTVIEQ